MSSSPSLDITSSCHPAWLAQQGISLAFTTYQSNRLLLLGLNPNAQRSGVLRTFERPMGLVATPDCPLTRKTSSPVLLMQPSPSAVLTLMVVGFTREQIQ